MSYVFSEETRFVNQLTAGSAGARFVGGGLARGQRQERGVRDRGSAAAKLEETEAQAFPPAAAAGRNRQGGKDGSE